MYRSSSAGSTAYVSETTAVLDRSLDRKMMALVAAMIREEEYRQAARALMECGPKVDVPTDVDLRTRGIRVRF